MLLEKVLAHAEATPSQVAVVDDKRTLSYRELAWGGNIMAGHIERLAPQDRLIGLLLPPSAAFAVAWMGTRWAGRIPLPLNYLLRPQELAGVIQDSGLKVIFAVKHFAAALAPLEQLGVKVHFMEDLSFLKVPGNRPVPTPGPDEMGVIMYTSGTSGTPKGVVLSNRNLESDAENAVTFARFTDKMTFLGVLPMFHTLGLQANCLIPLSLGCKCVYVARFSPVAVFEAVAKHKCEVLVAVPSMFALLASAKSAKPDSLAPLKYTISGGEPLPVALVQSFKEKFGHQLVEGFGLTETAAILAINVPWDYKIGSVGKLIPETEIKILDDDNNPLPANKDGLIMVKGPQIMKGYFNKPAETAAVLSPDGWFNTGDIGHVDGEGFVFITGRKKDMIIMAGEKIFPREIEDVLKHHPAVVLAAVIGAKDPTRGEVPVAFVQLDPAHTPAPSEAELKTFVRERIAPYKTPRDIYFSDELPKNATGKVLKRELVNLLPGQAGSFK